MLKISPNDILIGHSRPIIKLTNRIRKLIKKTLPEVTEVGYKGWHAIGYRHPEAGYLCGIFPFEDHIKIYFEYGRFLYDPSNILSGDSKQTKYITIQDLKDLKKNSFKNLLQVSLDFRLNSLSEN